MAIYFHLAFEAICRPSFPMNNRSPSSSHLNLTDSIGIGALATSLLVWIIVPTFGWKIVGAAVATGGAILLAYRSHWTYAFSIPIRSAIAVVVTAAILVPCAIQLRNQWNDEHLAYAYIALPERMDDGHGGLSLGLHMMIRDYPTTEDARHGIGSLSSLEHVSAIATTPVYVSPIDDGWCSCIIGQVADVSEWNNDDGLRYRLGEITATTGTHIIEFQTTTRNGVSTGVVILNTRDLDLDYEEWISGTVQASGEKSIFRVHETSSPKGQSIVDVKTTDVKVDKALLTKYGVPTGPLSADLLRGRCTNGSRYSVVFHGDGKTKTFVRHHDACGQ